MALPVKYDTPARYKVLRNAYIGGLYILASTEEVPRFVDYDGHPGTGLEPTDDEGRRRQDRYFASKGRTAAQADEQRRRLTDGAFDAGALGQTPGAPPPPSISGVVAPNPAAVTIPDDWHRTMNAGDRVLLAAKLGAPDTVNTAPLANDFIEAEIARRKAAAPA